LIPYSPEIKKQMQEMYSRLSEQDKRWYAGVEALKLPYGGVSYIAELFGCSRNTVMRGIIELGGQETVPRNRERKAGGGRKQVVETKGQGDIDVVFLSLLKEHTAGDPIDEKVKWTNLTKANIALLLTKQGFAVSRNIVKKLLKKHYESEGNPVISVDTKKKELIGNLSRNGKIYTTETIEVFDHDFPSLAEGVAIPHTIYDTQQNQAYVTIGTSRDTSEFACDSIRHCWNTYGKLLYMTATSILMLMDGGGSNSSRHYIFKQDLQALADELGIDIRVAHYPPYTSKWNPIEHRVFPHITRALQGIVLTSHALTKELIETTTTKTGLRVFAGILNKIYQINRKVAADFKASMRIVFDDLLGQWNYVAIPKNEIWWMLSCSSYFMHITLWKKTESCNLG
jgi:hypothetical protein